jgi:hypothetical protein
MPFTPGEIVQSLRDLKMAGFSVPRGSKGTVTAVMLQTSVLFDGFDMPLAVPDGDVEAVPVPAALNAPPKDAGSESSPLKRVRARVGTHAGGLTIPEGATGTVTSDAPMMNASWVLFDGMPSDVLIPNRLLAVQEFIA